MELSRSLSDEQFEKLDPLYKFSPSRLSKHRGCEMRGHYEYNLRLEPGLGSVASQALSLGMIVHRFLELYYKNGLDAGSAWPIIEKEFPKYEEKLLAITALTLMTRYGIVRKTDKDLFKVIDVEKRLTVPYTTPNGVQVWLDGRLDLIAEDHLGRLGVWDHKTDSRRRWSTEGLFFDSQLLHYVCILYLCDLMPEYILLNQIYTGIKDSKRVASEPADNLFQRFVSLPTPARIEQHLKYIGRQIDHILECEPEFNTGAHCTFCPFRHACALKLEGKSAEPVLAQFARKGEDNFQVEVDLAGYEDLLN